LFFYKTYSAIDFKEGGIMKSAKVFLALILCLAVASGLNAQITRQTGIIRGIITDQSGEALPGVTVTASGPALIGVMNGASSADGAYRCTSLPPGTYLITAELQGFKILKREGVVVRVGQVITINLQMEASALNEELTVTATAPVVDVQSNKMVTRIGADELAKLPLGRRFANIIAMTPGVVEDFASDKLTGMGTGVIHGGTTYSQSFEVDGVNTNDPAHNASTLFTPQYDAIEEVDVETGALSAAVGNTSGNFINVVTKSGGNVFHGTANGYYTAKALAKSLYPKEMLSALGQVAPTYPIHNFDLSGSLGGPIIKDKVWFFTTIAREDALYSSVFIPKVLGGPYTTPPKLYTGYDPKNTFLDGFLKVSAQLSSKLRVFVMGNYSHQNLKYAGYGSSTSTAETTLTKDNNNRMTGTASASWQVSSNTLVDFRAGGTLFQYPIVYNKEFFAGPQQGYSDWGNGYGWGDGWAWASDIRRYNVQGSARLTHFKDGFLGGDHEFGAGIEYQIGQEKWAWFKKSPYMEMLWNGDPYIQQGMGLPVDAYGNGILMFQICGPDDWKTFTAPTRAGFGGYLQDLWTIKNRLTISLGVRFDTVNGRIPAATKQATAGDLGIAIGETYIRPVYGFNPFGEMSTPAWNNAMKWTTFSPRIGVSYDLFGNGKTAVKAAFSRYAEALPVMYYQGNHPFSQSQWGWNPLWFYWWDDNGNHRPDVPGVGGDRYQFYDGIMTAYDPNPATYQAKIAKGIKAPYYNEIVAGVDHELVADLHIGLKYFYRERKNAVDTMLYDRNSGRFWNTYDKAQDWWVPFTTTLPAIGNYPAQEVTLYYFSKNAPFNQRFVLFDNVPEAKRQYRALELSFDKRYRKGWALGGSVVVSKLTGNYNGRGGDTNGFSTAFDTPNWFVNKTGRSEDDRPLAIKLYGTFDLPWGFVSSLYYTHYAGFPYQRTVTVVAPAGWAEAHNAMPGAMYVNAEPQGSRRNQDYDNVDFRLEKNFNVSVGKLTLGVDVYNLLGNRYLQTGLNPGGTWVPNDANTGGTYSPDWSYGKTQGLSGVRIFKFNIIFTF
jgi:hypothetical protein